MDEIQAKFFDKGHIPMKWLFHTFLFGAWLGDSNNCFFPLSFRLKDGRSVWWLVSKRNSLPLTLIRMALNYSVYLGCHLDSIVHFSYSNLVSTCSLLCQAHKILEDMTPIFGSRV